MKNTDIVFECHKCGHLFFTSKNTLKEKLITLMERDCPNCGREGYRNWILLREGNYDKEYGKQFEWINTNDL